MARGSDDVTSPAKTGSLLRREIVLEEDFAVLSRDKARPEGRILPDGITIKKRRARDGSRLEEIADADGLRFSYPAKDGVMHQGMHSTDPATIRKTLKTATGEHTVEVWVKRYSNTYHPVDIREEHRNNQGELHSPREDQPALVLVEEDGVGLKKTVSFYRNGQLSKTVVYTVADSTSETGYADTVEIFDAEGNLHSFDGLPARVYRDNLSEWYEHGNPLKDQSGDYSVFSLANELIPDSEFSEIESYIANIANPL
jgi:hypothetical protein